MTYIYLGSPYTHHDPKVRQKRYTEAAKAVVHLMNLDYTVYSPVVHFHYLAMEFNLPKNYAFWKRTNGDMLRISKALYVLQLDGWEDSIGLTEEIRIAKATKMPITTIPPVKDVKPAAV